MRLVASRCFRFKYSILPSIAWRCVFAILRSLDVWCIAICLTWNLALSHHVSMLSKSAFFVNQFCQKAIKSVLNDALASSVLLKW